MPGFVPVMIWVPIFVYFAVAWPYLLGTWLAVEQFGAANPSAERSVAGWAMQVLVLVAIVALVMWFRSRAAAARNVAALADLDEALASARHVARQLRAAPQGVPARVPRPGTRLLVAFDDAGLVEHRAPSRGAQREPTVVADGRVVVSEAGLHFVGSDRIVTWLLRDVLEVREEADYVLLPVTSRSIVSGVSVGSARMEPLLVAVEWAQALAEGSGVEGPSRDARRLVKSLKAKREVVAALVG